MEQHTTDHSGAREFGRLLEGYAAGTLSESELRAFFAALPAHEQAIAEKMLADMQSGRYDGQTDVSTRDRMFGRLALHMHPQRRFRLLPRIAAAAAVLLLLMAGGWAWQRFSAGAPPAVETASAATVQPIMPGGEKALLTLGDGAVVQLDSAGNGELAQQGGTAVAKLNSGMLAYQRAGHAVGAPVYNKVSTPKGGVYTVLLPDGTRAYLNTASSIRFPTAFRGKRSVEITGEVYFEVAKNPAAKFEVAAGDTKVTVYGTHFNVNAYEDEPVTSVTLLEGAVSVANGADSVALRPGQQAQAAAGIRQVDKQIDLEEVMAWKNGVFHFENLALPEIMRQISRWYDVTVAYSGKAPARRFSGIVSRQANIEEVLRFMQLAGVRFEITGRNITVIQ